MFTQPLELKIFLEEKKGLKIAEKTKFSKQNSFELRKNLLSAEKQQANKIAVHPKIIAVDHHRTPT